MKTLKDLKKDGIIINPKQYIVNREANINDKDSISYSFIKNLDEDKCTYEKSYGGPIEIEEVYYEKDIKDMVKENLTELHNQDDIVLFKKMFNIE